MFGALANAIQPDVSIVYYADLPICTTYNLERYLAKAQGGQVAEIFNDEFGEQLGFDIGQAAAAKYYTINSPQVDATVLVSNEFQSACRDFHYSNLLRPLIECGIDNQACFFMLSEILTQINSVIAFHENGIFSDALEMKYGTVVLYAACRSIAQFASNAFSKLEYYCCTHDGAMTLSNLVPRNMRITIEASENLRHVFTHYDFPKYLDTCDYQSKGPEEILAALTLKTVKMNPEDYLVWLQGALPELSSRINDLIQLPRQSIVEGDATVE